MDDRCDFCGAIQCFIAFIVKCFLEEDLLCKYLDMNVYFSEKDIFFYFNRAILPLNVTFIVNLWGSTIYINRNGLKENPIFYYFR